MSSEELKKTATAEPANAPGRAEMAVESRQGSDVANGANEYISWGARTDVGLVRGHNEDSFLIQVPVFAVCDGMGGHAAGEVASAIAVKSIAGASPATCDDVLLGAAVEGANAAVIKGAEKGIGKLGMGCTASCCYVDRGRMAIAHVGDSRIYLLRHGALVRVTHDHSYVEELVDSGQITPDEARTHPSRSIITRALGSDPDMYADHFSLEVSNGDRIILCSDGLSSMIPDSEIEAVAVSSATPQQAADNLVASALTAGGLDNVTVIVVDVTDDGTAELHRKNLLKRVGVVAGVLVALLALTVGIVFAFIRGEWYLGNNNGTVAIYQGVNGSFMGVSMNSLVEESAVSVSDLPSSVQDQLDEGIRVTNEQAGRETLNAYRAQIDNEKSAAANVADAASSEGDPGAPADAPADSGAPGTDTSADASADASADTTSTTTDAAKGGE
ncbi:Stp1/IreP family PP2C-type Ser/Thr phosphatase [Paratractidigestivibacter sp.]|uniref:Stp1/IreP family PP2C-type Ser/Thr phosphatase n=2 Tax=Paratractidigestivibacter sp. TaxID=2847316 RepID=UPI002ABDDF0D|nr:Stp1/IreP family PP2C-type Ser/Thr phosphatase [Paratractidigestivibacter sp.]